MAEQDKKKEPYSKSLSHSVHILLFVWCRYWVSSEKSGFRPLRMAASVCWSGIGMLYGTNASGYRLDISTMPSHTSPLSLSASHVSLSVTFSLSISIITTSEWSEEVRIRPRCRIMSDSRCVHPKNKVCYRIIIIKKKNPNKMRSTSYASHFHSLCALNVWKRIAERVSRSKTKEIGRSRQLSLLCLACHTTMCMADN